MILIWTVTYFWNYQWNTLYRIELTCRICWTSLLNLADDSLCSGCQWRAHFSAYYPPDDNFSSIYLTFVIFLFFFVVKSPLQFRLYSFVISKDLKREQIHSNFITKNFIHILRLFIVIIRCFYFYLGQLNIRKQQQ